MFYKWILKPFFFLLDPETAHHVVSFLMKVIMALPGMKSFVSALYVVNDRHLERNVFNITFPNPVGMAAGFDKNAKLFDELACLGFGFIEIGTVTPLPQPGNDKPRMFRLPKDEALINRLGFNNEGAKAAANRLRKRNSNIIIGGNIGKNKITPNDKAISDYEICFRALYDVVDYFVVNVSSPNTPGLRELQEKEPLKKLLNHLQTVNSQLNTKSGRKPLLLKIAPDLTDEQLDDIIDIVIETKLEGVVATNTTITRNDLLTASGIVKEFGAGGLSGKPLSKRSTEVIRYLSDRSKGRFKIIGVGGIHSPEDAIEKLNAGADLIQLYTGFIYEGPALIKRINKAIANFKPSFQTKGVSEPLLQ